MVERKRSWLFPEKPDLPPVWTEGEGKKVRYFIELKGHEIEFRPVEAYTLWVLRRTYMTQLPKVPVIELELEGIDAVQRAPDYSNAEFIAATNAVYQEMDIQIMYELMKGIVVPKDDAWAADWLDLGRPLPAPDTAQNKALRRDIYLSQQGFSGLERIMLVRMIQAVSEETAEAIERAQELFRNYLGRTEDEGSEDAEWGASDDAAGRDRVGDEGLGQDTPEMVQDPVGGPVADGGEQPQLGDEVVREQSVRRRSKKS